MGLDFSNVNIIKSVLILFMNQVVMLLVMTWFEVEWGVQFANVGASIGYLLTILYYLNQASVTDEKLNWRAVLTVSGRKDLAGCFISQLLISVGAYQLVTGFIYQLNPNFLNTLITNSQIESTNPIDMAISFFCVALLVPISEELLFRGIILSHLRQSRGVTQAIIISSLLFGVLHGLDFIGATVFGYLCGWLYEKYKNLWIPIFLHGINNSLACFIQLITMEGDLSLGIMLRPEIMLYHAITNLIILMVGFIILKTVLKPVRKLS